MSHPLVRLEVHFGHPERVRHELATHDAVLVLQHHVRGAVREENRQVLRVRAHRVREVFPQREVRGHPHGAGEPLRKPERRLQRDDAALAEPADDDAIGVNAPVDLRLDESLDVFGGREGLSPVVLDVVDGQVVDVVPAGHAHAPVKGDWDRGGCWKDPLDALEGHGRRDVRPAVAGVAEAVEEDANGRGGTALGRGHDDGFRVRHRHGVRSARRGGRRRDDQRGEREAEGSSTRRVSSRGRGRAGRVARGFGSEVERRDSGRQAVHSSSGRGHMSSASRVEVRRDVDGESIVRALRANEAAKRAAQLKKIAQ